MNGKPANNGPRFLAFLIDAIIIGVIKGVLFRWNSNNFGTGLVGLIYYVTLTYYEGATFGKKLLKIKVTDEKGKKLTFTQVIMREVVGKFVSGIVLGIGYLWILFDDKKQGWHDKIAHTLVVKMK